MIKRSTQDIEERVLTSYYLSLIIAQQGLHHATGKNMFNPVIRIVLDKVIHFKNISIVIGSIPLSNNTVKDIMMKYVLRKS